MEAADTDEAAEPTPEKTEPVEEAAVETTEEKPVEVDSAGEGKTNLKSVKPDVCRATLFLKT